MSKCSGKAPKYVALLLQDTCSEQIKMMVIPSTGSIPPEFNAKRYFGCKNLMCFHGSFQLEERFKGFTTTQASKDIENTLKQLESGRMLGRKYIRLSCSCCSSGIHQCVSIYVLHGRQDNGIVFFAIQNHYGYSHVLSTYMVNSPI